MLTLRCPCCGADCAETELVPGGEAHLIRRGPGSGDDAFAAYLFMRANPKGVHFERWRHAMGCGKWFHAARCTATLEVFATYPAQVSEPPAEAVAAIRARRPGWQPVSR
ncbi:MAG: sarcosine oxidase subunit delta [Paracoccaceae bacterium]